MWKEMLIVLVLVAAYFIFFRREGFGEDTPVPEESQGTSNITDSTKVLSDSNKDLSASLKISSNRTAITKYLGEMRTNLILHTVQNITQMGSDPSVEDMTKFNTMFQMVQNISTFIAITLPSLK